jgi:hypothetical protein
MVHLIWKDICKELGGYPRTQMIQPPKGEIVVTQCGKCWDTLKIGKQSPGGATQVFL